MDIKTYKILTEDGQVTRANATRPYVAGWVGFDKDGKVVKNTFSEFTTKPKWQAEPKHEGRGGRVAFWKYTKLIPVEIGAKS